MSDTTTKTIRIVPGSIELPHTISLFGHQIVFNPDAEVPASIADSYVKTHPKLYCFAQGKPDMSLYKVKSTWKTGLLVDRIKQLSDAQQLAVYEFAGKLLEGKATEPGEDDGLEELTIKDLLQKAEKQRIDIPKGVTKKEDIIEFLRMSPEERSQFSE